MAEIVNLRQARKRKARAEHAREGAENRAKFGRPTAEKAHDAANAELARKQLEQLKLTPGDGSGS